MTRAGLLLCLAVLSGCATAPGAGTAPSSRRIQAALASGDGRTSATAIEIGRLSDAYLVLRARGLAFQRHEVVRERDQPFDVITARRRGGGEDRLVFSLIPDTADDQRVARLVRRLMTSGNGQDAATAFATAAAPQEDEVLRLLGLQRTERAVLRQQGHLYDVVTAIDPADGTRRDLYFRLPDEPARGTETAARRS